MEYTGERAVPWNRETGAWLMRQHAMRYAWALSYVANKRVVDLGCGTGYGAFMLSWVAADVIALDVNYDTIAWARRQFMARNLHFYPHNIASEPIPPAEVYVAFEVLEHIEDPQPIIEQCRPLIWSMPIQDGSQFHVRPYTKQEIAEMLGGFRWTQTIDGLIAGLENSAQATHVLGIRGMLE